MGGPAKRLLCYTYVKCFKKTKEKVDVYSFELLSYIDKVNPKADINAEQGEENALPEYFITADDITLSSAKKASAPVESKDEDEDDALSYFQKLAEA